KYEFGGTNGGYRLDARGKNGGLLTGKRIRYLAANSTLTSIDNDGNFDYTLNEWHHIVVTYDLDTVKYFIDGVLTNKEKASLSTITSNNFNLALGGPSDDSNNGTGFNFKGSLDEVRIYNRVISLNEIKAIFADNPVRLTENLIAYYPFNGNLNDYSNNGNHLTTVIGTQFASNRFGAALSAISFAGGNDRVLAPSSPSLNSITNGISISMWIYQTSANCATCAEQIPNYGYNLISKSPAGQNLGGFDFYARGYNHSPNVTGRKMRLVSGLISPTSNQVTDTEDASDYSLFEWHHLVVTYDLSTVKYYLDNVLTTTVTSRLDSISRNNFNLSIGGSSDDSFS
ncbi:MAG: LamG domain-containing protein, partial [Cytophagales bacterium]|nr:LamG domain-containing protein [Cytophagales bacterium]